MNSLFRKRIPVAFLSTVALAGALINAPVAQAHQVPEGGYLNNFNNFYKNPAALPQQPAQVVRTQPFSGTLRYPGGEDAAQKVRGTRVMYTTTDALGKQLPVTGAMFDTSALWRGKGETPLIVFAPGTLGQGAQCGASKTAGRLLMLSPASAADGTQGDQKLSLVTNYETIAVMKLLSRGFKVFVVDYVGSNQGPQSYVNNIEAGHALLDAARVAISTKYTSTDTPVGFFGYSQGGGASAVGTTLHNSYAPDVNLVTSYIGGPPLDLAEVMNQIDGTMIAAGGLYALNALMKRYPDVDKFMQKKLNQEGKDLLAKLEHQCIADSILSAGFKKSETLTVDGKSFYEYATQDDPLRTRLLEQYAAAMKKPSVPALVVANPYDDIVGYPQMEAGAKTWCSKGAAIKFVRFIVEGRMPGNSVPHMIPAFAATDMAIEFMVNGFNGILPQRCTVTEVH